MTREQLAVKYLDGGAFSGVKVDENSIETYVQTKRMIERVDDFILAPFESLVKERGQAGLVFGDERYQVDLVEKNLPIKNSQRDIFNKTFDLLRTFYSLSNSSIRCDGVKKYGGQAAVCSNYLLSDLNKFESEILGRKKAKSIVYEAENMEDILRVHTPRVLIRDMIDTNKTFDENDVFLYMAGDSLVSRLKRDVIVPFESEVKSMSNPSLEGSVFDTFDFENSTIQVKSVPRDEPNYKLINEKFKDKVECYLNQISGSIDRNSYRNSRRVNPSIYVSIPHLLSELRGGLNETQTKMRQEINILYKPDDFQVVL